MNKYFICSTFSLLVAATVLLIFNIYYYETIPLVSYIFKRPHPSKSTTKENLVKFSSNKTTTNIIAKTIVQQSEYSLPSIPKIDYDHYKKLLEELQRFLSYASKSIVSAEERVIYRRVIKEFIEFADSYKLDYFIEGGTLLGSYRHHGFVPWDDDFDVSINYNERQRIKDIFAKLKKEGKSKLVLNTEQGVRWKIYLDIPESKKAGGYHFKWPYIDLLFHKENNGILRDTGFGTTWKKSDIYPLSRRYFEGMMIRSPRCMRNILSEKGRSECCANHYNHKKEYGLPGGNKVCIKCDLLSQFPLVTHKKINDTAYNETLYMGNKVIHSFVFRDCL